MIWQGVIGKKLWQNTKVSSNSGKIIPLECYRLTIGIKKPIVLAPNQKKEMIFTNIIKGAKRLRRG